MLEELLDRLANGGIEVHVIDLGKPATPRAAELQEISTELTQLNSAQRTLLSLLGALTRNGYTAKADALKAWWEVQTVELDKFTSEVKEAGLFPDQAGMDQTIARYQEIKPGLEHLLERWHAIRDRQMVAVCEVDIEDLLT